MTKDTKRIPATRTAALSALSRFVPHAGRDYTARRNYDLGPGRHTGVSQLSPYVRHRIVTEAEVLEATLARHSPKAAEKFVQEVFWRTYWKGWLEMRPSVWLSYKADVQRALDDLQTQSGLRSEWEDACLGRTGIACFDDWAQELAETGYLHNHARMWFASIWIFTLRLPWALGADFFLRHLLDGDPASNTLSWRWVAGLQTRGKHYVARAANIAKYTEERHRPAPGTLITDPAPLDGPPHPERLPAPTSAPFDPRTPWVLVLHDDDLSPAWLLNEGGPPLGTVVLPPSQMSPLQMAPQVTAFREAAMTDCVTRWQERLGEVRRGPLGRDAEDIADWARDLGAEQIVAPYAPVGPNADALRSLDLSSLALVQPIRPYDARAWPYATAGFFKFKEKIPRLLGEMKGLRAA